LSKFFAGKYEKKIIRLYSEADVILSSAGGYLNDFYGFEWRLKAFQMGLHFKRKIILFGQSVGPFFDNQKNDHKSLIKAMEKFYKIILREEYSLRNLKSIGYNKNNIVLSTDIAFTLSKRINFSQKVALKNNSIIALAFRAWQNDEHTTFIIAKAVLLSSFLISQGYHLIFLSTCQGIEGYKDDSKIAIEIIRQLNIEDQKYCKIDSNRYSPLELIKNYGKFDAYIGMRLHGAILSMIGGTPAFNIGYEEKTRGIFEFLGLENNCIWYEKDIDNWINAISIFLDNLNYIKLSLEEKVSKASKIAEKNFSDI
jgi:colanic acid/amylovoran biosynthesis protein